MIRVSALEKALPDDWRRAVRDHPFLSIAGAALVGVYLGRSHGRAILAALVGVGVSAGTVSARRILGVEPPSRSARGR